MQLRTRSHLSSQQQLTLQKQPEYPKKPLTSYNFFVKDTNDLIVRNNPGMSSVIIYLPPPNIISDHHNIKCLICFFKITFSKMEIASLSEKMFKALSKKKKQNYVQLARVAREKYQKQVQEFK